MEVEADLGGDSFYEVTFQAKIGDDPWEPIGTDDNAPYRVFHDVYALEPGTQVQYKAVVLDNAGHTRESAARCARVGEPSISVSRPAGRAHRDPCHPDPELSHYVVTIQRKVGDGPWTAIGSDDSSPVYTVFDTPNPTAPSTARSSTTAPARSPARRRARHRRRSSTTSAPPATTPTGACTCSARRSRRRPTGPRRSSATAPMRFGARLRIVIADPTKPVNFIVHRPGGDSVPTTREPGGDRSFIPAQHNEIWLKQGDATVYFSPPG